MSTDAVTLLFALLAITAQAGVAAAGLLALAGRFHPVAARWRASAAAAVAPDALPLAVVVAAVCTAGSLYLSEVAHFPPCFWCWVQRGFMYPLVVVLALAAWGRSTAARALAGVMAAVGGSVSIYHMLLERFPQLESTACDPDNPCSLIWVERFGYLTIPTMALSGFALILTLVLVAGLAARSGSEPGTPSERVPAP